MSGIVRVPLDLKGSRWMTKTAKAGAAEAAGAPGEADMRSLPGEGRRKPGLDLGMCRGEE